MPARPTGVTVTWPVRDGDSVTVGDTPVRVFAVRGHTQGSAAYLIKGVLFLGDAADTTDAGEIVGAPWVFSDSQSDDRASLVRLTRVLEEAHADVKALAFSHSGVRTQGLAPLIAFAQKNP